MTRSTSNDPAGNVAALAAAAALLLAAVGPVAAAGMAAAGNEATGGAGNDLAGAGNLAIGVQQGAGSATVSVSHDGTAVENATLRVTGDASYNGTGTYATDATGIASLPLPGANATATVAIEAAKDGLTGSKTVTLQGNAGRGPGFVSPGQRIAAFVQGLRSGGIISMGASVSGYVHALGPHRSSPAGVVAATNAEAPRELGQRGAPAHASAGERGPPEHAGPPDHARGAKPASGSETDDGERGHGPPPHAGADDGAEDASNGSGPPGHAGPSDDGGNASIEGADGGGGPPDHAKGDNGKDDAGPRDGEEDGKQQNGNDHAKSEEDGDDGEDDDGGNPGKANGRGR